MALTTCYECGDKLSSLAELCPHCGAPMTHKLIHSARVGNVESVRELLRHGADVDEKDDDGSTALILACREGHIPKLYPSFWNAGPT